MPEPWPALAAPMNPKAKADWHLNCSSGLREDRGHPRGRPSSTHAEAGRNHRRGAAKLPRGFGGPGCKVVRRCGRAKLLHDAGEGAGKQVGGGAGVSFFCWTARVGVRPLRLPELGSDPFDCQSWGQTPSTARVGVKPLRLPKLGSNPFDCQSWGQTPSTAKVGVKPLRLPELGSDPFDCQSWGQTPSTAKVGARPLRLPELGSNPFDCQSWGQTPSTAKVGVKPLRLPKLGSNPFDCQSWGQTPSTAKVGVRPLRLPELGSNPFDCQSWGSTAICAALRLCSSAIVPLTETHLRHDHSTAGVCLRPRVWTLAKELGGAAIKQHCKVNTCIVAGLFWQLVWLILSFICATKRSNRTRTNEIDRLCAVKTECLETRK
jgi:hypothetical protein